MPTTHAARRTTGVSRTIQSPYHQTLSSQLYKLKIEHQQPYPKTHNPRTLLDPNRKSKYTNAIVH